MHPDDVKRLEREREIFRATRGPDYAEVNAYIRRAREEAAKGRAARAEHQKRQSLRWMDTGEL